MVSMRFVLFLMTLTIVRVRCENINNTELVDFSDAEDHAFLWKHLFIKLNGVLSETEKLNQNLLDVNKRLDDLSKRQDVQEAHLTKLMENVYEINKNDKFRHLSSTWTSILRRQDDTVDFNRGWNDYRGGFGDPNGNFFIGLQRLHELTTAGPPFELLIVLKDFNNEMRYAKYDLFRIGNETEKFILKNLGIYSGDAGDSLREHVGHKFTTYDQDNDNNNERNCAVVFMGGWWFFGLCYTGYLAGPYRIEQTAATWGISWNGWKGWNVSMKYGEMMIRPKLT